MPSLVSTESDNFFILYHDIPKMLFTKLSIYEPREYKPNTDHLEKEKMEIILKRQGKANMYS